MRPADVCGLAMKPISSRSAITLRIVAGESSRPGMLRQRARADRLALGDIALDQRLQQESGREDRACRLFYRRARTRAFGRRSFGRPHRRHWPAWPCSGCGLIGAMYPARHLPAARFRRVALIGRHVTPGIAEPLSRLAAFLAAPRSRGGHRCRYRAVDADRRVSDGGRRKTGRRAPTSRSCSAATGRCSRSRASSRRSTSR